MSIASIANKVACSGSGENLNTGKLGCLSLFGTPAHALRFPKGYKISGSTDFDLAFLTPLIQAGTVIPIMGASNFEDLSAEDGYSTNTKGVKRLNLKGLIEFKLTFEEGHEFYRQMEKLRSFKSDDFIIGDDDGNWLVVENSDGTYGGFSAGHVTPEATKRKVPGGDAEMKSVLIQFLNRLQWDKNYSILHAEELDFYPEEMPTVNGAHFEFVSVPVTGATSIDVTAHLKGDHDTAVVGLDTANFVLTVQGATATLGTVTETPDGTYNIAITTPAALALSDVLVLGTIDGNSNVVDLSGVLFRADNVTETVIAP